MADEATGRRLPTIRLMDEELYNASTTEQIQKFRSRIQSVPYSFKEMKDLDLVEISAMYCLNMLNPEHAAMRVGSQFPWVWAPCFLHILFGLRRNLFVETFGGDGEQVLPSTERQSAKELSAAIRRDISQVINSRLLPYVQARIQRHIAATDTWKKAYEVELSKAIENARHKEISTPQGNMSKVQDVVGWRNRANADLQARVLNLQDELSTSRTTQEQALQGQSGPEFLKSRMNYGCCKSFTKTLMKAMQQAQLENV
ncbi:hypothetical protein R1flu_022434 [Riccia fluitans]|uniref:Uncharacterized protein n=1 Tax=Riccia fluitans TaxID=41844 RepID=A0ABD1XI73_9MARC